MNGIHFVQQLLYIKTCKQVLAYRRSLVKIIFFDFLTFFPVNIKKTAKTSKNVYGNQSINDVLIICYIFNAKVFNQLVI